MPVAEAGDDSVPAVATGRGGAGGHPDAVVERAVERGVLTGAEAELIGASRLEETSLRILAAQQGGGYWALAKRRSRAEERLVRALVDGDLDPGPVPQRLAVALHECPRSTGPRRARARTPC
ncbi:hypothetical protein [Streptomonospora alba]|uniref:hypothetical protein n=1 Tax=Streptomonospora alba TaxID=183763 RepID=UPI0012ED9ACF|nr:hypothetical protein [Streptomonospora alba]